MGKKIPLIKHITIKELRTLIRRERNIRVLQRLLFINQLYIKNDVYDACRRMCIARRTGYTYLKNWNKQGYEGLIPNFGGGRPSKLAEEQKEELERILRSKENWLTGEVMGLIKEEFGVSYSLRHVSRMLRSLGMHYSKPYPEDYRRPENAEEVLRERLNDALRNTGGRCVLGFFDEASPQTTDNKQRFWSFKRSKIVKNTTKYRANTFGFYPVNGRSVLGFKENSRKESVCEFLGAIRERNPGKAIIVVLDNFSSHASGKTREYARSLGIRLVFLPPYSPDLNPIEQIWRCVRRRLSQVFVRSESSFLETIRTTFHRLAKKPSFMSGWLETFQPVFK